MNRSVFPQQQRKHQRVARTQISSHASGGVIPRIDNRGSVEFLVFDYTYRMETTVRNVMGGNEGTENPMKTLIREIDQELREKGTPPFEIEFYDDPVIFCDIVNDQDTPNGFHLKVFYLIKSFKGKLRSDVMIDTTKMEKETHGVPRYVEAHELLESMRVDPNCKRVHMLALQMGLVSLAVRYPAVAGRYSRFLAQESAVIPAIAAEYLSRQ